MISIVIPVKSDPSIRSCLERLRHIMRPVETEIIVVDGSPKPMHDIQAGYPEVQWVQFTAPAHKQYAVAEQRNMGVQQAQGDYIVFIDADCIPEDDWLVKLYAPTQEGELYITGRVRSRQKVVHDIVWDKLADVRYRDSAGTANSLISRIVFDSVGGFDESFEAGEDIDFSWRACDAGFKIRYVHDAVIYDEWGPLAHDLRRAVRYGKARAMLYAKHPKRISKGLSNDYVTFIYPLYIALLPLTIIFPFYPLLILVPLLKNITRSPLHMLAFNLYYGWGVLTNSWRIVVGNK